MGPQGVSGCARRATAPEEVVLLDEKEKETRPMLSLGLCQQARMRPVALQRRPCGEPGGTSCAHVWPWEAPSTLQGGQPPRSRASRALLVSLGAWGHGGHS